MAYVSFMSDRHLLSCIEQLYNAYDECKKDFSLNDFYKNKIDPVKFFFDMKFNDIDIEDYINAEITRKNDKSISNAIGDFHQSLLDGLDGFEAPNGAGYDVRKLDNSIFGELKNKWNTMNAGGKRSVMQNLLDYANEYPLATCYLIEVISLRSQNRLWKLTDHDVIYEHPRVRIISADKFYELATGRSNAFKELCDAIPNATTDFLRLRGITPSQAATNSRVYEELCELADTNEVDILTQMFIDTFSTYNGY